MELLLRSQFWQVRLLQEIKGWVHRTLPTIECFLVGCELGDWLLYYDRWISPTECYVLEIYCWSTFQSCIIGLLLGCRIYQRGRPCYIAWWWLNFTRASYHHRYSSGESGLLARSRLCGLLNFDDLVPHPDSHAHQQGVGSHLLLEARVNILSYRLLVDKVILSHPVVVVCSHLETPSFLGS